MGRVISARLTKRQREQLLELADIRDKGSTGEAYWMPHGSEFQTADALRYRGYLQIEGYSGGRAYMLTDAGYTAVRPPEEAQR